MAPTPGAPAPKKKRTGLYIALGCLGLIGLCCLTGAVTAGVTGSMAGGAAKTHVDTFLTAMQVGSFDAAYPSLVYEVQYATIPKTQMQQCINATAIGDISAFECESPGLQFKDPVGVECTLTSRSKGQVAATFMVNNPVDDPYMGFIYFDSRAAFDPTWSSDLCSTRSGSQGVMQPPAGRIRP